MAIKYLAGNWLTGLSTDTKPTAANLPAGSIFFETDTMTTYQQLSGAWTSQNSFAQTLTNKTIDANSNTFLNTLNSPFALNARRIGFMIPGSTAAGSRGLALGGWPSAGTYTSVNDTTEGIVSNFNSSTSGSIIGYISDNVAPLMTQRTYSPVFKARVLADTTTNSRVYIGFSSNKVLPATTDTPLGTTEHGILAGFSTATANFSVFNNDGSGSAEVVTSMGVAKDTAWHTFSFTFSSTDVTVVLDDGAGLKTQVVNTRMPGLTTSIYGNVLMALNAASSMNFQVKGILYSSTK